MICNGVKKLDLGMMFKLKKIRTRACFSGMIVLLLSISLVLMVISALISIRIVHINTVADLERNIAKHTVGLFLKDTQRRAEECSSIFKKVFGLVTALSEQAALNIKSINNYDFNKNKILSYCKKFNLDDKNGPLINSTVPDAITVYTGKEKKIPEKLQKKLYSFSLLNPLLKQACLANSNFFSSWIWFCDDNIITIYSKNDGYRNILSTDKGYKDFINQIESISDNDNLDKIKLTNNHINIAGESVLTAILGHYNDRGKLLFVTGIDLQLDKQINDIINNKVPIFVYDEQKSLDKVSTFAFIINPENKQLILSKSNLSIPLSSKAGSFICEKLKGKHDFFTFFLDNKKYLLTFSKISVCDWYLGTAVLEKNFLSNVQKSGNRVSMKFIGFEIILFLNFVIFLIISIFILIVFFEKYIIKPISKLRDDVSRMGHGDFDLTIRNKGVSEIKDLAESFSILGHKVEENITTLNLEVSKRNQREKEMRIAKRIQQSVLPRVTSTFHDNKINLYARLHPANNVAGDFYDFFFLSKKRLVLLIADVSGKGVSAAFYMTIAKNTIRNACINEPEDPAKALRLSNELLCEYNLKMFVSVFLIYYDMDTGLFHYGNAGHNEPAILKSDGENKFFGLQHDIVLGIFPDLKFHTGKGHFDIGDTVVLYTDGITEANALNENCFGEERLINYLAQKRNLSAENLCRSLIAHVHSFEKGNQYDDMTVLTFKRKS